LTVKDLNILLGNRSLKNIVIVDNTFKCYCGHIENGIPISTFKGDPNDKVMLLLRNYLFEKIMSTVDVREVIKSDFRLEELLKEYENDLK